MDNRIYHIIEMLFWEEMMSRQVFLDIKIESHETVSAQSIIEQLLRQGWTPLKNGEILHLPIGDQGDYNWISDAISYEEFCAQTAVKEQKGETIGVNLYWEDTDIGISLLITEPNQLLIDLGINRRYLDESVCLTDFNWYAERILVGLQKQYHVCHYCFDYMF